MTDHTTRFARFIETIPPAARRGLLPALGRLQGDIVDNEFGSEPRTEAEAIEAAREWFQASIGHQRREHYAAILLDAQGRILASEVLTVGATVCVSITPRHLAEFIFQHPTSSLLLAHNHPSGSPQPSGRDRELALRVARAFGEFSVSIKCFVVTPSTFVEIPT